MGKTRRKIKDIGGIWPLLIGCGICLLVLLVCSILLGLYSVSTDSPTKLVDVLGLWGLLASGAISGFVNRKMNKERGVGFLFLISLLFVLVLILIGLVACGGALPPRCLVNYLCYIGIYMLAVVLGGRKSNKRRR